MNRDKRCVIGEGQANGLANITVHFDEDEMRDLMNDNCCTKLYNCLKGSASYRTMKVNTTNMENILLH